MRLRILLQRDSFRSTSKRLKTSGSPSILVSSWMLGPTPPTGNMWSLLEVGLLSLQNETDVGGYLRNTMGWGDFGIPSRRHFILGEEQYSTCLKKLWIQCQIIFFWMENYGKPQNNSVHSNVFYLSEYHLFLLWRFGRDNFQEAMKLSKRTAPAEVDWGKFTYMVFDVPNHRGGYQERYNHMGMSPSHLFVLELFTLCIFVLNFSLSGHA